MPEININTPKDLKKFEGWEIRALRAIVKPPDNYYELELSHQAAEKHVILSFHVGLETSFHGAAVTVKPALNLMTADKAGDGTQA